MRAPRPERPPDTAREPLRETVEATLQEQGGAIARRLGPARLSRLLGLEALMELREQALLRTAPTFSDALLDALDVDWRVVEGAAEAIPATGGLLVVCTHPTGGLEALICHSLIDRRRGDRRNLGNGLVRFIPELAERQIAVTPGRLGENVAALSAARRHLRAGGCLLAFPAGTVAHARLPSLRVREAPWHPIVARLATASGATLLPIVVEARSSRLWRVGSALSRTARTALLARALLGQRGKRAKVRILPLMSAPDAIDWHFCTRP